MSLLKSISNIVDKLLAFVSRETIVLRSKMLITVSFFYENGGLKCIKVENLLKT